MLQSLTGDGGDFSGGTVDAELVAAIGSDFGIDDSVGKVTRFTETLPYFCLGIED